MISMFYSVGSSSMYATLPNICGCHVTLTLIYKQSFPHQPRCFLPLDINNQRSTNSSNLKTFQWQKTEELFHHENVTISTIQ